MDTYRATRSATRGMRTDPEKPKAAGAGTGAAAGVGAITSADQARQLGGQTTQVPGAPSESSRLPQSQLELNYKAGGFDAVKNNTPGWYDLPEWMRTRVLRGMHDGE